MPPRHVYWTILVGDAPTAFRAHDRADLLPTFERLRKKQPDVVLKYFARGRLWASAEDARAAGDPPRPSEPRGREWRPGGTHKDPRDRFKKKNRPERAWSENRSGSASCFSSAACSSTRDCTPSNMTTHRSRSPSPLAYR